jgi:hypothetical protein
LMNIVRYINDRISDLTQNTVTALNIWGENSIQQVKDMLESYTSMLHPAVVIDILTEEVSLTGERNCILLTMPKSQNLFVQDAHVALTNLCK